MSGPIRVSYCLTGPQLPVDSRHPLWRRPLPLHPDDFTGAPSRETSQHITYGEYFQATHAFLERNGWEALTCSIRELTDRDVTPGHMDAVNIQLIKHGEWYHPARVSACVQGEWYWFALNVAVSETGRRQAAAEFQTLEKLNGGYPVSFIPKTFKWGYGGSGNETEYPMFLTQWLTAFNEFHLSRIPGTGKQCVTVWGEETGNICLSQAQSDDVIRQASMILSYYYNPFTTEQIFPWHHAAGDFVVNLTDRKPQVRLITTRSYAPLIRGFAANADKNPDPGEMVDALILFFLNTALRMRLDRLDGVGEWVWHAASSAPSICRGFMEGVSLAGMVHGLPEEFGQLVFRQIKHMGAPEIIQLCDGCIRRYKDKAVRQLMETQLAPHGAALFNAVEGLVQ